MNPTLLDQIRRHVRQRRNDALVLPSRSQHLRVSNPLQSRPSLGEEAIRLTRVAVALHMASSARQTASSGVSESEARS